MALAMLGLLLVAAEPEDDGATERSIVTARVGEQRFGDEFTCPPEDICLRYPARTVVRAVRTVAGPRAPSRFAARIWLHTRLGTGTRVAMIVEPRDGFYEVRSWSPILGGRACLPSGLVDAMEPLLAGISNTSGDERCLTL